MEIFKNIVLLGTSNLTTGNKIIAYNSNIFIDEYITNSLALSNSEIELLKQDLNSSNLLSIYNILSKHEEFEIIDKDITESNIDRYIFNNDRHNCLTGKGFDTIIFLYDKDVLGSVTLLKLQGYNSEEKGNVRLKKNYLIKNIIIDIDPKYNEIRVDLDKIYLLNNILISNISSKKFNFLTKESKVFDEINNINYNNYCRSILDTINSKFSSDILTSNYCNYRNNKFSLYKLNIRKNIELSENYLNFENFQIGYYSGDPSIFMWNNLGEYSIYSITSTIGDIFNDPNITNLKSYTVPRKDNLGNYISNTEIYTIPKLNGILPKIKYFSGKYIVCELDNTYYLFDIENQAELDPLNNGWILKDKLKTGNILYYSRDNIESPWVKENNNINNIECNLYESLNLVPEDSKDYLVAITEYLPILSTKFLVDKIDPFSKLYIFKKDWNFTSEVLSEFPQISNTNLDLDKLISNNNILEGKVGSWLIFTNRILNTRTYTTFNKTIKFRLNEPEPIVVNDQIIIGKQRNTYTIFNEDGYYISYYFKQTIESTIYVDSESFNTEYKYYNPKIQVDKIFEITKNTTVLDLNNSFFNYFKRSTLPKNLINFEIIGGLNGLIFYRNNNIINYL